MSNQSQPPLRIFVSHSIKDNDFGMRIVDDLRRVLDDDNAIWYDRYGGLYGGDSWWPTIMREIKARSVFIVILSPNATKSKWVNAEIDLAWRQMLSPTGKHIIPLLYRPCDIRDDLDTLQNIRFTAPTSYEYAFNELCLALRLSPQIQTGIPSRSSSLHYVPQQTDQEPTNNEEIYQAYIEKMLPVLLEKQLLPENEGARSAVRERTMIVLSQLNGKSKGRVLQFLHKGHLLEAQRMLQFLHKGRLPEVQPPIIDLQGADLSEADLVSTNLSNAALRAVNLRHANLEHANLRGVDLREAKLDQANLHAAKLESSDLSGVWLEQTNLEHVELNQANLRGAFASKVKLVMSDLIGADLREAILLEADLSSADLSNADLSGAFLGRLGNGYKHNEQYEYKHGTDLRGANLSNAQMRNTNLVDVNLSRANLSNAILENADLRGADLRWATMIGTNLKGADLRGANLIGADTHNASLSFILPLGTTEEQIEGVVREMRLNRAEKKQAAEKLRAQALSSNVNVITIKQLVAKLAAVGTIITEEQLMAAGSFELTNTVDLVIAYYIPNWAWKKSAETPETTSRSLKVGRLAEYLETHGTPVESYNGTTIQTSTANILYTEESRLTARLMQEIQFESDRSDPPDYPQWL